MQLTPQTAILGYTDAEDEKLYCKITSCYYSKSLSMNQEQQNVWYFISLYINWLRQIEKTISATNKNKLTAYNMKWSRLE